MLGISLNYSKKFTFFDKNPTAFMKSAYTEVINQL